MSLSKDLREFIECLNSNRVEYLIVGALAVSWHAPGMDIPGTPRTWISLSAPAVGMQNSC